MIRLPTWLRYAIVRAESEIFGSDRLRGYPAIEATTLEFTATVGETRLEAITKQQDKDIIVCDTGDSNDIS